MTEERTIPVEGMTCGGCEQSVQRAVGDLDGVESVAADHAAGTVAVVFDPTLADQDAISARIREAGYTVPA